MNMWFYFVHPWCRATHMPTLLRDLLRQWPWPPAWHQKLGHCAKPYKSRQWGELEGYGMWCRCGLNIK